MSRQPTELIAEYVYNLRWEDLPQEVVECAKLRVLDYLASAMAGYKLNHAFNETITKMFREMGGKKESGVLFSDLQLPALNAAFLNAAYGHGADIDDGHRTAQGHPGIVIIPPALALGVAEKITGRELIVSIIAGYDIFVRLATAINPSHFNRGFHTTGTVGTIAAGGAAAKALRLDRNAVHHALSLAAIQAGGLHEISESGQSAKPLSPAKAASGGVLAGRMAYLGIGGPQLPLEGGKGFLKAFTDKFDLEVLQKDFGQKFAITSCYVKLYPACRHSHGALDAAISLNKILAGSLEQIEKVKIHTYPAAIKITGGIAEPVSKDEAKFSLPYAVATGLLKGKFGLEHLVVERSFDGKVRNLVRKIEIVSDPTMEDRTANVRGAKIQVLLRDGTSKEVAVQLPKGDPEVPVSQKDVENKLNLCAEGLIPADRQQALIETVWELEKMRDLSLLVNLCGSLPQLNTKQETVNR